MPRIPLYAFQPTASPSSNVRADPGMFNQEAAAGQRVGSAVAGLGETLADVGVRLQHAQDYKSTTMLQMGMEEEWDKFQNELNPATDETKWQADWQKRLDARLAKDMPKTASPVLRQQIELQSQQFKVRTSGDVGHQAKAVGVEKAKVAGETRTAQLWRNGDPMGATTELHKMADLGLILPEQIPGMIQKGMGRMEQQQATNLIATDPIAASTALEEKTEGGAWKNFKKLDEDDRLALINHARTQTTALQTETFQGLIDALNNGEAAQPESLQALVDKKLLKPSQAKTYNAAYRHGKFNTDVGQIGELFTAINTYNPEADADNTGKAKLLGRIATAGFPQNVQTQMNELLGKKADPKNELNTPVAKDTFEAIDQRFKLGIYGRYETRKMDPKTGLWSTEVNPKVYETALVTKRRVEDGTRKFLKDNPTATAEQVNKFVADFTKTARLRSAFVPTLNPLTGKVPAKP